MTTKSLGSDDITFGKYKDLKLDRVLRDRKYCQWLLAQDWFQRQYGHLYTVVKNYDPKIYFIRPEFENNVADFNQCLTNYKFFNLVPLKDLKIELDQNDKKCYSFYLEMLTVIKNKLERAGNFNITAPTKWLQMFEEKYGLSRDIFKEFLTAHELPNLPSIIEELKKMGGYTYNGAKSYLIAKEKSLAQEQFWEILLKKIYADSIGVQFKYEKCIFDFIHTGLKILYECKLGLKDFDQAQFVKYQLVSKNNEYNLVYLIGTDCVVDLARKTIYTTNPRYYQLYFATSESLTPLDLIIKDFSINSLVEIADYFFTTNKC